MLANQEATYAQNGCSTDFLLCGKTRKDKIRNEHFRERLEVASVEEKTEKPI